jgi:hypothetical protein
VKPRGLRDRDEQGHAAAREAPALRCERRGANAIIGPL